MADLTKSIRHNLAIQVSQYPVWRYQQPTNRLCHNLCTTLHPPSNYSFLLGLGLNFCPTPRPTPFSTIEEVTTRFRRDFFTRVFFSGAPSDFAPGQLFIRSDWEPPPNDIPPDHRARNALFTRSVHQWYRSGKYRRRIPYNLTAYQSYLLRTIQASPEFIVFPTDKNLGPAIVERSVYVQRALADHLSDTTTYQRLSETDANHKIRLLEIRIRNFLRRFAPNRDELLSEPIAGTDLEPGQVSDSDRKYIDRALQQTDDPFAHFYITAKVHKTPWKTRPIVSVCGSITHGIARWLDQQLQPLAKRVPSYLESSFDLKTKLFNSNVDWSRIRFFTFDAKAMYTNIDTDHALRVLSKFLRTHSLCRDVTNKEAIIEALEIVMRNNIFQFGDTYWIQRCGTAMGTPPGCSYATLYYAIHELEFVPGFEFRCPIYYRYIDDGIGGWSIHPDPATDQRYWESFQSKLPFGKLEWEVSTRDVSVHFLDLTLVIAGDKLTTKIYEKPENLYLYIPPHSAHPPGLLRSMVTSQITRFVRLCSNDDDCFSTMRDFYRRLRVRGYQPETLKPLFSSAYHSATSPQLTAPKLQADLADLYLDYLRQGIPVPSYFYETQSDHRIFLHLPFHPSDPPRRAFQQLLSKSILKPDNEPLLSQTVNLANQAVEIDRVTIAYHRPPNLRRKLFARRFRAADGLPVSSFLDDTES